MIAYLPKSQHDQVRKALHDAYDQETYKAAKAALEALKPSLALMNASAPNSLEEGLEGTVTLHRLGLMPQLKQSFRTTNCIESLNAMVAQRTRNVKRWNNSDQRYRWLATALLDIEPKLQRIKGFRFQSHSAHRVNRPAIPVSFARYKSYIRGTYIYTRASTNSPKLPSSRTVNREARAIRMSAAFPRAD